GGGAGLHRRDGALQPERRRAGPEHLREAGGGGTLSGGARPAERRARPGRDARRRGGRRSLVAPRPDGPHRRGGGADGAIRGGGAPRQARLRGGPGVPRLLPEAGLLGPPRGERRPPGLPDDAGRRLPAADGRTLVPPRHPHSRQDVKRPIVGVTIGYSSENREVFSLRDDYVRAVESAGGLPLVLAPGTPEDAPLLLDRLDGLLLTGGADVDPTHYGEEPHESVTRVIPE